MRARVYTVWPNEKKTHTNICTRTAEAGDDSRCYRCCGLCLTDGDDGAGGDGESLERTR